MKNFSTKLAKEKHKNILRLKHNIITEKFRMKHNKFVADPIKKASGNVAFVLQMH